MTLKSENRERMRQAAFATVELIRKWVPPGGLQRNAIFTVE